MSKKEEIIWDIDLFLINDIFKKTTNYSANNYFYVVNYKRSYKISKPRKVIFCQPQFDKYKIAKKFYSLQELIIQNKVKKLNIPDYIIENLLIINKSIKLNKPLNKKTIFYI